MFRRADVKSLVANNEDPDDDGSINDEGEAASMKSEREAFAQKCAGLAKDGSNNPIKASSMLQTIDDMISSISNRITKLGAAQNRIESAIESIAVQSENITSSLSTLRDADVATESSNYIKSQILQQASATLLSTANQSPSIALNLL